MATHLHEVVAQQIAEEIEKMTLDVIMGKAKDYADYKYYCGIIRGLTKANSLTQELAQQMRQDDDDE